MKTRVKQLAVIGLLLALVGVAAALAGSTIVMLTGSEMMTPLGGGLLGAALGVSAGTVIGRLLRRRRTVLDLLMQVAIAGGLAALTLWFLQNY